MHSVLILGCGAIAGGYDRDRPAEALPLSHAGAFARDPRFAIAACVDPDGPARDAFARRWDVPAQAPAPDDLAAGPGDFDVVSICSPTSLHADHLEQALALRPRVIFCEKPVAETVDDAERLVAMCAREGVSLAVNYTRRCAPDLVALAGEVRAGDWGRLLSATGWYGKGVVHNGGHMVDLLRMFAGDLHLVAAGTPVFDHFDRDPTVPALLRSDAGADIHLVAGDSRALTQFELVISCERGEIAMRDGGRRIEVRRPAESGTFAGYRELGLPQSRDGRYLEAMTLAVANIADHLADGTPLASTGTNALAAQRLCEAIRDAATNTMKETRSHD